MVDVDVLRSSVNSRLLLRGLHSPSSLDRGLMSILDCVHLSVTNILNKILKTNLMLDIRECQRMVKGKR